MKATPETPTTCEVDVNKKKAVRQLKIVLLDYYAKWTSTEKGHVWTPAKSCHVPTEKNVRWSTISQYVVAPKALPKTNWRGFAPWLAAARLIPIAGLRRPVARPLLGPKLASMSVAVPNARQDPFAYLITIEPNASVAMGLAATLITGVDALKPWKLGVLLMSNVLKTKCAGTKCVCNLCSLYSDPNLNRSFFQIDNFPKLENFGSTNWSKLWL